MTSGRLFLDGGVLTPENSEPLRERRHAAHNGVLIVSVVLDKRGRIAEGLEIRSIGLPGDLENTLEDALDDVADTVEAAINRLERADRDDDERVENAVSRAVKKVSQRLWERRPVVETIVVRV